MLDSVRLEIVLILTQDRCTVCAERTTASENHFGRTRWNSKVTWVMWNLVLVHLKIVLVSVKDKCTVCTKHTVGTKIILDTPHGTPRCQGSSGSSI
jgi:hypothetical protein